MIHFFWEKMNSPLISNYSANIDELIRCRHNEICNYIVRGIRNTIPITM